MAGRRNPLESFNMRSYADRSLGLVIAAGLLLGLGQPVLAQRPPAKPTGDSAGLAKTAKEYLAALQRGDSKQIASFWTSDGTYVDETGRSFKVRELFAPGGTSPGSIRPHTEIKNVGVRFVTADVALEEGDCETESAGGTSPMQGRFVALWVRQNNTWKLENLQEWRVQAKAAPTSLTVLEPLVGEWSGSAGPVAMRVSAHWNSNKTFLHREVSIKHEGKVAVTATQEIGWDEASQAIKSWTFNSDGSHGEGIWSQQGNVWLVTTNRILRDGHTIEIAHAYKFPDKNTIVVKAIQSGESSDAGRDFEIKLTRDAGAK
jgi:ketosteroid isomerase-like protein